MTAPIAAFPPYLPPARPHNAQGAVRRVGLEVELANLSLEATLEIIHQAVGGQVLTTSRTEGSVADTPYGDFRVELDSKPLQERRYLAPLQLFGIEADSDTAHFIEDSVLEVAKEFVPIEIVSPPIAWDRLTELDSLWQRLREAGAHDTKGSVLYAFGLHLNPEVPDFEAPTFLSILRSFLLLEDWIVEASHTDLTRRITPYIRDFPEEYRRKILEPKYTPDLQALIADYAEHNPTRNRPLDLLPLFSYIYTTRGEGIESLSSRIHDWQLVGSRPTFHYRLPNCEVAQAGWTPALDWNRWVTVEQLADRPELLTELSEAYLSTFDLPLRLQRGAWADKVRDRVIDSIPGPLQRAQE